MYCGTSDLRRTGWIGRLASGPWRVEVDELAVVELLAGGRIIGGHGADFLESDYALDLQSFLDVFHRHLGFSLVALEHDFLGQLPQDGNRDGVVDVEAQLRAALKRCNGVINPSTFSRGRSLGVESLSSHL
jgi:hypothetical protein